MLPWFIAIQPFYIINAHNWFTVLFGAWTKILFKCRFIIFLVTKWIVFHIKTKQFFIKYYSLQKKEYFATINAIPTNLIIFRYNYIQFVFILLPNRWLPDKCRRLFWSFTLPVWQLLQRKYLFNIRSCC